jgi:hypothetical protein
MRKQPELRELREYSHQLRPHRISLRESGFAVAASRLRNYRKRRRSLGEWPGQF